MTFGSRKRKPLTLTIMVAITHVTIIAGFVPNHRPVFRSEQERAFSITHLYDSDGPGPSSSLNKFVIDDANAPDETSTKNNKNSNNKNNNNNKTYFNFGRMDWTGKTSLGSFWNKTALDKNVTGNELLEDSLSEREEASRGNQAREQDSVTLMKKETALKNMVILPKAIPSLSMGALQPPTTSHKVSELLPLSNPEHYSGRIDGDIRRLAASITASIQDPEEWRVFSQEEGSGLTPLTDCLGYSLASLTEAPDTRKQRLSPTSAARVEDDFVDACRATRAIRDLCSLSPLLSAVVTEEILRASSQNDRNVIDDLVSLLKYTTDSESELSHGHVDAAKDNLISKRKTCRLYVVQLLLTMAISSDDAISTFRATPGFVDAVRAVSAFAPPKPQRQKRRPFRKNVTPTAETPLHRAIIGTANQLLAAMGVNIWKPKSPNQRGLRILTLDGGGSRGIAAVTTLQSIVEATGGKEVCDTFDIIAGTSTGAIIAFLVGLRRESSQLARKRYDDLVQRIFVKNPLRAPMLVFTTASYDENPFMGVMTEILGDDSMLDARKDEKVPLVFALSSKMSQSPIQLCLFRNYNYAGGEEEDPFVVQVEDARTELGLTPEFEWREGHEQQNKKHSTDALTGSRHPGSFRVLQKIAMRATTAAPTVFKPVLMADELYCDGGIVASNPTAVAIHEARTLFPDIPIELVVSCGTGGFDTKRNAPRIGWDAIISQIVNSATDAEQTHHVLEDILGKGTTTNKCQSSLGQTNYFRLNPMVGQPNDFPIDGTDPQKLEDLVQITKRYLEEDEQVEKLNQIRDILKGRSYRWGDRWWRKWFSI